jgi:hypothetical protein
MDSFDPICPQTKESPLFNGELLASREATQIYLSVYCNNGLSGRLDCKRFLVFRAGFNPPHDLMPGNMRSVEDICKNRSV